MPSPINITLISEPSKNEIILKNGSRSITFPRNELPFHLEMTVQSHPSYTAGSTIPVNIEYVSPDEQNVLRVLPKGAWLARNTSDGAVTLSPDANAVSKGEAHPVMSGITHVMQGPVARVFPGLTIENMHNFADIFKFKVDQIVFPQRYGSTSVEVEQENNALKTVLSDIGATFVASGRGVFPFDPESATFFEPIQPKSDILIGYPVNTQRIIATEPPLDNFKAMLINLGIPKNTVDGITSDKGMLPFKVTREDLGALPDELHQDLAHKIRYKAVHATGHMTLGGLTEKTTDELNAEILADALDETLMYASETTIPFYLESALVSLGAPYSEALRSDVNALSYYDNKDFYNSVYTTLKAHTSDDPVPNLGIKH
tara:strand:+ start:289 stop:1407 length:1119 start_codon:yes stop_codon:yes gene_type:complete